MALASGAAQAGGGDGGKGGGGKGGGGKGGKPGPVVVHKKDRNHHHGHGGHGGVFVIGAGGIFAGNVVVGRDCWYQRATVWDPFLHAYVVRTVKVCG